MPTAINTAVSFSEAGIASVGPATMGHQWQIMISVPSALAGQGFQVLSGISVGTYALGTIQGQGSVGPFALGGGQSLTVQVVNGPVPAGPVQIQGYDYNLATETPGPVFGGNTGGTNSVQPVPAQNNVAGSGTITTTPSTVITAPSAGKILLRAVYVGALVGGFEGVVVLVINPGSVQVAQFSLLQTPFVLDYERYALGPGKELQIYTGSSTISAAWTFTWDTY
jgi:hypothetical protein